MPRPSDVRRDLAILTGLDGHADVPEVYDRVAVRYDRFRDLWLRAAGGPAEAAMLDDLQQTLAPSASVLDAGCGTGAVARKVLELQPGAEVTLLDASSGMLAHTRDIAARERVQGTLEALPFRDGSFDVVVAAWVIETVPDPALAVGEMLRVLAPDGRLIYTFCSLPQGFFSRAGSAWLRVAVKRGFAGAFLSAEQTPWHDCAESHLQRFDGGLVSEVLLRPCCHVAPAVLPQPHP